MPWKSLRGPRVAFPSREGRLFPEIEAVSMTDKMQTLHGTRAC